MLDYLWAGMLIFGILWGLLQGRGAELTQAVLDGGKEAIDLSLTMLGVMAIWTGLMEIAEKCGVLQSIHRLLRPVIRWLFPGLPKGHPAAESISTNFAANMLGLGNAATPAALKAMKELQELEEERTGEANLQPERKTALTCPDKFTASDEMCTFIIINISSLQLIPVNMLAYRSQYGSVNPAAITAPVLVATVISTLVGVSVCKLFQRRGQQRKIVPKRRRM